MHGDRGGAEAEVEGELGDGDAAEVLQQDMGIDGDPMVEAEADEETRTPRICRRPQAPTKQMVEEHNRTHAEYRDWCPDCRAGKSTGLHHRRGDPDEDKLGVTISVDYAFRLAEEQEEGMIPILVA